MEQLFYSVAIFVLLSVLNVYCAPRVVRNKSLYKWILYLISAAALLFLAYTRGNVVLAGLCPMLVSYFFVKRKIEQHNPLKITFADFSDNGACDWSKHEKLENLRHNEAAKQNQYREWHFAYCRTMAFLCLIAFCVQATLAL